jgi:DNA sulfur modification protein DndD
MSANENDALIQQIRDEKNIVENEIEQCEQNIRSIYELMGSLQREAAIIKKQISELSKKVSLDDSDAQKDALADQLINELDTFLKALKKEKKTSLEVRLKHIMNSLMHKEDFISSVSVNVLEDGLDIDLIASDGTIIRKDTLSKGEQQLYATSLLKALVEESGIDFPVFIDSPLQKFDKSHSNKIITEFYPSISKQVVLFPLLHKELTEPELEIMKPMVNSTYLIVNEESRSFFKKIHTNALMEY